MDDDDEDDNVGGNPERPEIFLPPMVDQAPSIMAQEPEDTEDLEGLESLRLRYAADGGRIGFQGGGRDMGSVPDSQGNVGPGGVEVLDIKE